MDPINQVDDGTELNCVVEDTGTQHKQETKSSSSSPVVPTVPLKATESSQTSENVSTNKNSQLNQLLEQFLAYEANLSMSDYIKRFYQIRLEQEAFRCDAEFAARCASENVHVMRNRYRDILPYDRNRVVLAKTDENPNGYINASFISLPRGQIRFIAAQAPLATTLEEWWKMVDEQKVDLIVMLCKLVEMNKVKCERYWPSEVGQSLIFGCYEVTLEAEESFAYDDYLLRRLRMTNQISGYSKTINQLHYMEWPDHGCPSGERQLINMIEKMAELQGQSDTPVLVHCSAGVGRTGTIISVNYIRELIGSKELDSLDIFDLVMRLRKQRASMVQTQDQYQFVHKCVAYYCRKQLGIQQPEPRDDSSLGLSQSVPISMAPIFSASAPEHDDPLIQLGDDSSDECEENSVPDFPHEPPAPRGPEELGSAAS